MKSLWKLSSLKNTNAWKCRSFCCCLVAIYYFETVLKNFGKWRRKGGPASHLSRSILQKFCNFSVLKQVLFICTNFHNDWFKTCPDIRNLVFLLIEELYRKLAVVLKVCQSLFLKVIFWEVVSVNKIEFHKIRCRCWSAVCFKPKIWT